MSPGHRGQTAPRDQSESSRPRSGLDPLYRRLPRGPHGIDRAQVAANQRARIHGAIVETVARRGIEGVTVREVISLAGVSRRSFYEHFGNRDDCFLQTVLAVTAQMLDAAVRSCASPAQGGLDAAFAQLAAEACAAPDAALLALRESLAFGDAGVAILGDGLLAAERRLAAALSPPGSALPAGVMRALGGALTEVLAAGVEAGRDPARLGREMAALARAARPPDTRSGLALAELLEARARRSRAPRGGRPSPGERERILASAMSAAARQPLARLGAAQVADGAGVPIEIFAAEFGDVERCLLEAVELCHARLGATAARARELGADWPESTRLALAGMLSHLAAEPAQARMVALVAHRAVAPTRSRSRQLERELGSALRAGGPPSAPSAAAIAGALLGPVRRMLLHGLLERLPGFSDHAAYVVLAPALGPDGALAAIGGNAAGER